MKDGRHPAAPLPSPPPCPGAWPTPPFTVGEAPAVGQATTGMPTATPLTAAVVVDVVEVGGGNVDAVPDVVANRELPHPEAPSTRRAAPSKPRVKRRRPPDPSITRTLPAAGLQAGVPTGSRTR